MQINYKYRFTLSKCTPRTTDGMYLLWFDGREIKTPNKIVEFSAGRELTLEEFNERVKGTEGIENVYGVFKDTSRIELTKFLKWVNDNYISYKGSENKWIKNKDIFTTEEVVIDFLDKQTLILN